MTHLPINIGRFKVHRLLGQGGFGAVYLASDEWMDRKVAINVMHAGDVVARKRLIREARTAGRLQHPNIVTIFDIGEYDGQPFIAMEYLVGQSLTSIIRERQTLSLTRRVGLLRELCDGLGYAHRAGLVHRDIKPDNLIVTSEGRLKILDFGIARDLALSASMGIVGSPQYMPAAK